MFKLSLLSILLSVWAQSDIKFNEQDTLHGITEKHEELSMLKELYRKTEMKFKIEQSRDATIFMPVNSAFDDFASALLTYPQLVRILNYLSLGEVVNLSELKLGNHSLETIEGSHLNVTITQDQNKHKLFTLNNKANVIGNAEETINGIAYIIDKFLIPPSMEEELETSTASKAPTNVPAISPLENLQVPAHIEASNRENNRYDLTPAKTTTVPPSEWPITSGKFTTTSGAVRGVIPKNRRMSQQKRDGVFLPARARSPGKENVVHVGQNKGKSSRYETIFV